MSKVKLTCDQKYMCKAMGTKLPILPVDGSAEAKLFADLVAELPSPLDFSNMALAWHSKVDGKVIFPKLPVYLRVYHTKWLRNTRIRDALNRMAVPLEQLRTRLAADLPPAAPARPTAPVPAQPAAPSPAPAARAPPAAPALATPAAASPAQPVIAQPLARLPHALPKPPVRAVAVAAVADDGTPQVVGGVRIGPSPVVAGEAPGGHATGKCKRGKDRPHVKRVRTCTRCKAWGDAEQGKVCKGRTRLGRNACEFHQDDEPPEADDVPDGREEEDGEDRD